MNDVVFDEYDVLSSICRESLCLCGCGMVVNKGRKYRSEHNPTSRMTGKHHSEETKIVWPDEIEDRCLLKRKLKRFHNA